MIKISNITKKYNPKKSNEFEALHGVSCEINDGELVAVIGKSGAGKSTLLHILACIDNYQEGEYTIDGTLVKNLALPCLFFHYEFLHIAFLKDFLPEFRQ